METRRLTKKPACKRHNKPKQIFLFSQQQRILPIKKPDLQHKKQTKLRLENNLLR